MCGRFTGLTYDEIRDVIDMLERDAGFDVWEDWAEEREGERFESRDDSFPGSAANLIVSDAAGGAGGAGGARGAGAAPAMAPALLTWGYDVSWQKNPVFNTRIESALSGSGGGMWRDSIEHRRCVVPTLGFYEPHATERTISPRTGKPVKRPYRFEMPGGVPTLLAGVWQGDRFSVVTTEPNAWVRPVHDRMPLVLHPAEVPAWLWGSRDEYAALADRSSFELAARPQGELADAAAASPGGGQLTLF